MARRTRRSNNKSCRQQVLKLFAQARAYGEDKHALVREGGQEAIAAKIFDSDTFERYQGVALRFVEDVGKERGNRNFLLISITPAELDRYIADRTEKVTNGDLSAYTVRAEIQALKKMENLINEHYGKVDWQIPTDRRERREKWNVALRRRDAVRPQHGPAYAKADADRLVATLAAKHGQKVRDAIIFLRATGARAQTVTDRMGNAIRPSRIDLTRGTVTLLEKGGKTRTVRYDREYHGELKRIVETYGKNGPDQPIFGLDQRRLNDWVRKAAGRLGIENRGLHGFRKEFAVKRHKEYQDMIKAHAAKGNAKALAGLGISSRLSRDLIRAAVVGKGRIEARFDKAIDKAARLNLSRDLGHNRIEVTYRYVPK